MGLVSIFGSSCKVESLCPPTEGRVGFFSKGDCVLARAEFFQGHELLTYFGNKDLPEMDRFTDEEVQLIADGNRRVDWPLELLVHLNNGVAAYASALIDHTNQPQVQRMHFLLTDTNTTTEAASDSTRKLIEITSNAVSLWVENRERSLTLVGQANHIIQDSFSPAHTVRRRDGGWCIEKVKAYIPRAPGFLDDDIEFHGTREDTIGHITSEDSIYREGRECLEPQNISAIEECLSDFARQGRVATRDYLQIVRRILSQAGSPPNGQGGTTSDGVPSKLSSLVANELSGFIETHVSLCNETRSGP